MKEVALAGSRLPLATASFLACIATIVECRLDELPQPGPGEDPARDLAIARFLGGFGLGLVPVADASSFSWPGPWIARLGSPAFDAPRAVVMYGFPSGVVWDPSGASEQEGWSIADGFVVSVTDVALARPSRAPAPTAPGTIEAIWVARDAQAPPSALETVSLAAGRGLGGDRYLDGTGSFPSGPPGSALTLIDAAVCESFSPPLAGGEHRRNVVTRGIDLNALVGREFTLGAVSCRGTRLCEPCSVLQRSAERPLLRPLVHRGGLRADILADGTISVGDPIRCTEPGERARTGSGAPD